MKKAKRYSTKRYSTEFKSPIVALYNEGRSVNSLANEYHLAVQTVTGWIKNLKSIPTALILKIVHFLV
ncbi:transposase [Leuconostoc lactis]|uniref:transposase n=1 Tax=Leuconostoc lactis TaxID=1246 RepID=UPI0035E3D763